MDSLPAPSEFTVQIANNSRYINQLLPILENRRVDRSSAQAQKEAKKVLKKRFGGVQRSPEVGLSRMMEAHAKEVYQFIDERVEQRESGNTTEDEK